MEGKRTYRFCQCLRNTSKKSCHTPTIINTICRTISIFYPINCETPNNLDKRNLISAGIFALPVPQDDLLGQLLQPGMAEAGGAEIGVQVCHGQNDPVGIRLPVGQVVADQGGQHGLRHALGGQLPQPCQGFLSKRNVIIPQGPQIGRAS